MGSRSRTHSLGSTTRTGNDSFCRSLPVDELNVVPGSFSTGTGRGLIRLAGKNWKNIPDGTGLSRGELKCAIFLNS